MMLDIPLHKQTADFTCGACATLMVQNYLDDKTQLTAKNEISIWADVAALPFKFSSPYRIAAFFIKKGFETKLIMIQGTIGEFTQLLECCQTDPAERELFTDFFKAHTVIMKKHISSAIVDRKPTLNDIIVALSNHSPVIALVDSYYTSKKRGARNPPHLFHWIVVRGHDNENFYINDSIDENGLKPGKIILDGQTLEKAMDIHSRFGWPSALIISERNNKSSSRVRHAMKNNRRKNNE